MRKSTDKNLEIMKDADHEAAIIIRRLMRKHGFIQPECPDFDVWSKNDAAELVADLIELIRYSEAIEIASKKLDWGK